MVAAQQVFYFPQLQHFHKLILAIAAFFFVAFGQPSLLGQLGVVASSVGFALFLVTVVDSVSFAHKFKCAFFWFFCVQLVHFSWAVSHLFLYIWIVYFLTAAALALQFGLWTALLNKRFIDNPWLIFPYAGLWTLFEWVRLFFMTGFTWNPVGLALTDNIYSLQMASLVGVYGLSFVIIATNLLAVRAMAFYSFKATFLWLTAVAVPFAFGFLHLRYHDNKAIDVLTEKDPITAILVQPAFPAEEAISFSDKKAMILYVIDEWRQLLTITAKYQGEKNELIVFPEFTVPLGTYSFVYPYDVVEKAFRDIYGSESVSKLPPLELPLAWSFDTPQGEKWFVSNAYWVQGIANNLEGAVLIGLEDADDAEDGVRHYYSAAVHIRPAAQRRRQEVRAGLPLNDFSFFAERYEKRILVPMGEYIPFNFLAELARKYGVFSSFTPGREAKVFQCGDLPFGISICYEETFGHLMRENKQLGAQALINLTNDVWYPNSRLPKVHFDHARLRTVECGIPLLRSCNSGITCCLDSLGRIVNLLGSTPQEQEWSSDALKVTVPRYTYSTLYSRFGDTPIILLSTLLVIFLLL